MNRDMIFTNLDIREMSTQNSEKSLIVEGYAVMWGDQTEVFDYLPDKGFVRFFEQFQKGAFAKSITARMGKDKKNSIKMLLQHNSQQILGTPTLVEDDKGLKFICEIERGVNPTNDGAIKQIESGDLKQISVGFNKQDYKLEERDDKYYLTHTEVRLWELSAVTWSAYENAQIESNRSKIGLLSMIREYGVDNVRAQIDAMTSTPTTPEQTETSVLDFNFTRKKSN